MFNMSVVAYKRWLLWLKISFFSILYHIALLFMIFFAYQDGFFEVELTVSSKGLGDDSPVMFVPIQYEQSISRVQQEKTKSVVVEGPRTTVNKKINKNKNKPSRSDGNLITELNEKAIKGLYPFQSKKVPSNSAVVEQVQKKSKKIDQKSAQKVQSKKLAKQVVQSEQKDVAIRVGYRDIETLRCYNVLQKELVKYWRPPIGVLDGCSCKIKIFVGWDGSILGIKMIKQSGVLMYDVSARSALFAMSMPRWAQGKSITITFE